MARIRIRDTVALLVAVVAGAFALGQGIAANLHVPAARIIAAECQGFEALATVGGTPMTCNAALVVQNADLATLPVAEPTGAIVDGPAARG